MNTLDPFRLAAQCSGTRLHRSVQRVDVNDANFIASTVCIYLFRHPIDPASGLKQTSAGLTLLRIRQWTPSVLRLAMGIFVTGPI